MAVRKDSTAFRRAMLSRARYCYGMSSVCTSVTLVDCDQPSVTWQHAVTARPVSEPEADDNRRVI